MIDIWDAFQEYIVTAAVIALLAYGVLCATDPLVPTPVMHTVAHPSCGVDAFRSPEDDSLCPDNNWRDI